MDSQHTTILHQQSVAHETLTALDYADDAAILAEMIETGDRTAGELVKNENSAHRAGQCEPVDTPGGSRERQLGIPWVTDILRWRKQI